jgi:hypothetical protein
MKMNFLKTTGVCSVVALALTMALSSASYASHPHSELGGPPLKAFLAPAPISSPISPLLTKELTVLTNQGISPQRALQAIRVQGKVARANLSRQLKAALATSYSGEWFVPAAAQLHIGVTSTASRRKVEQVVAQAALEPDVVITPVRSTMAQLVAVQEQWNRKLADLFAHAEVTTGLEPQHNAVSVVLGSAVPLRQRIALEHEASVAQANVLVTVSAGAHLDLDLQAKTSCKKGPAEVFVENEAYCDPPLTAGVRIAGPLNACVEEAVEKVGGFATKAECEARTMVGVKGKWVRNMSVCTAGPLAIPTANRKERVVLTAGHCIDKELGGGGLGAKWWAVNKEGKEKVIGTAQKYSLGVPAGEKGATYCGGLCNGGDFGDILMEPEPNGFWRTKKVNNPAFAVTAEWKKMNAKKEETSYPVKAEQLPVAKRIDCHVGQTSGESCGEIKRLNVTLTANITPEKLVFEEGLVEDTRTEAEELIGKGGDSGGPWAQIEANNEAIMEGTHVGIVFECEKVAHNVGVQFFPTEEQCRNTEITGGEGEWERKAKTNLVWNPLKKPVGGVEGPLEALKLELLTTANERIRPEFESSAKQKFTSKSTTSKLTNASESVTCSADTNAGELSSATTVGKLVITFTGCVAKKGTESCTVKSIGGSVKEGELVTKTLKGELGEVEESEAADEVGLLLEPESAKKILTLASTKCTTETSLEGTFAGEVTPLATSAKTAKLILATSSGKQKIKSITVKPGTTAKATKLELAGVEATAESTDEIAFEKALEVT